MGILERRSGDGGGTAAAPPVEARPGAITRFRTFLVEVREELKKTTWPSKKEVYGTTVVVIVAVFITALYLFVVDKALETGLHWVFRAFQR